ncbi:dihydroxyacetone kinase family protein [Nesterenkonia ebinurensis]|uniref:dihydroxyacetone kinase family protein n=1 Tax=Nesterenkonia ebinurensis TaxID=2608252 RepID=UPI00295F1304|nr:dihydroxyacetone kinase family protein [Nesterenkonia ebinurensis]
MLFDDPAKFMEDQLAGFLELYSDRLAGVEGGVVVSDVADRDQVAVVVGGGSGHYPAFSGLVGPGLAHGAVVGNIFTSPSARWAANVGRAADTGRGVVFAFGNYAGDVMNFGLAKQRLVAEGIDVRMVLVTDDIASANEPEKRRGIAGDFSVFKVLGATAAEGLGIDAVEAAGIRANAATRTLGVAFSGCTMPGAQEPLFQVPQGHLGLGLGIHGEPGIEDVPLMRAEQLARLFVDRILAEAPSEAGNRVAAILNGLGTTKYEELFLLWGKVSQELAARGLEVVQPEVGELVTSLDMGGCSLTLMWLDDDLERWWTADAYAPAFRKVSSALPKKSLASAEISTASQMEFAEADAAAQKLATDIRTVAESIATMLAENEDELGRIDAVAGDGDHGRGMLRGINAALQVLKELPEYAGPGPVLGAAGQAWADDAGGTSGVLWGAALEAAGARLENAMYYDAEVAAGVVQAFAQSMVDLGGAHEGDKTLLDSLLPFVQSLEKALHCGVELPQAWSAAAADATAAAADTAQMTPKVGRARPLAAKSLGTPDAGATSMAMIVNRIADHLK